MKKRVVRAEEFEVVDEAGHVRLRIGLTGDEHPFFSMLDADGSVRARFGVTSDGAAGLAIARRERQGPRHDRTVLGWFGIPGLRG